MKKRLICTLCVLLCLTTIIGFGSAPALAANESDMRSKVVSVAQNEVGYTGSSSWSKYGEWYGYQGSWCTYFVFWCFNKADKSLGTNMYGSIIPSGGNCNSMISWFSDKGVYKKSGSYTPKKGDLIFFDWSGNGSCQHVGIVKSYSSGKVTTIEGNCSGKVKEREYTKTGSKPYNNISAIMGYGAAKFSAKSSSSSKTTKKSTTKKKTTTKKAATNSAASNSKTTKKTNSTTKSADKNKGTTKKSTTKKADKNNKNKSSSIEKLSLSAATDTLELGDSVRLNYSIAPAGATAVVGYFCDDEGVININSDGKITAVGKGTATVVVCANDDKYSQYDFTVTDVNSDVTVHSDENTMSTIPGADKLSSQQSLKQKLVGAGINLDILSKGQPYYIIPAVIAASTFVIALVIIVVKRMKKE